MKKLISKLWRFATETERIKAMTARQGLQNCKRLARSSMKKENLVSDCIYKISRKIIDLARQTRDLRFAIGNATINSSEINIGKNNSEKFHYSPFGQIIHVITYKTMVEVVSIMIIKVDEIPSSQKYSARGTVERLNRKLQRMHPDIQVWPSN